MAARIAMMAMTTNSSIKVNPVAWCRLYLTRVGLGVMESSTYLPLALRSRCAISGRPRLMASKSSGMCKYPAR